MIRVKNVEEFIVNLSVPGTQSSGAEKACFVVPFACTLKALYAKLGVAGTTNNQDVDIEKNGTSILNSTGGIRFATTSQDPAAVTYPTDPPTFAKGDIITLDVDAVHSTPAINLCVLLVLMRGNRPRAVQNGGVGADAE